MTIPNQPIEPNKTLMLVKKLYMACLILGLLSACSATKPMPRCTEDFTPINPDAVAKP
jgi:hypothetical protein